MECYNTILFLSNSSLIPFTLARFRAVRPCPLWTTQVQDAITVQDVSRVSYHKRILDFSKLLPVQLSGPNVAPFVTFAEISMMFSVIKKTNGWGLRAGTHVPPNYSGNSRFESTLPSWFLHSFLFFVKCWSIAKKKGKCFLLFCCLFGCFFFFFLVRFRNGLRQK